MENLNLINQDFSTPKYQNYKSFRNNTDSYSKDQHCNCGDCLIQNGGDTNKQQNLIRSSTSKGSIPPQLMLYESASVFLDECDTLQHPYNNPRNSKYTPYKHDDLEISGTDNWISSASYNSNNKFQLPAQKYCPRHYKHYYNNKDTTMDNNNCYQHHSLSSMNIKGKNYCFDKNNCLNDKENSDIIYGGGTTGISANITLKNPSRTQHVLSSSNTHNVKNSTKICTIVFISLIFISIINGTLRCVENILNFMKLKLDTIIKKFWKKWDLSCLIRNKKSTQFKVLLLSPILAIIAICYSLICVSLIINIKLNGSVPTSLIKRINFNRLLGN